MKNKIYSKSQRTYIQDLIIGKSYNIHYTTQNVSTLHSGPIPHTYIGNNIFENDWCPCTFDLNKMCTIQEDGNLEILKYYIVGLEKDTEEVYNEVIQEYSEIGESDLGGDDIQEIIMNIVELVINYGDIVYNEIDINNYSIEQLLDYDYLKIQMETLINDYLTN